MLENDALSLLADLGHGVLDEALVEAAAYVFGRQGVKMALRLLESQDKEGDLRQMIAVPSTFGKYPLVSHRLASLPTVPIAYWAPPIVLACFSSLPNVEDQGVRPRVGLQTSDDFRFLRLQWEVPIDLVGTTGWAPFAKGGEYSPYSDSIHLCVNWNNNVSEMRAFCQQHEDWHGITCGTDARRDFGYYFAPGLTYSERTTSDISVRVLPAGCVSGKSGPEFPRRHARWSRCSCCFVIGCI